MITPGELVSLVAEATGLPKRSVAEIDRRLAKAGLRSVGGRGLSAAKMKSVDAANLLLGVMVGLDGPETARLVERVAALRPVKDHDLNVHADRWSFDWLPDQTAVSRGDHTMGELIAGLLEAARTGELQRVMREGENEAKRTSKLGPEGIESSIYISVGFAARTGEPGGSATIAFGFGEFLRYGHYKQRRLTGGLFIGREIEEDVILRIGEGLRGRSRQDVLGDAHGVSLR